MKKIILSVLIAAAILMANGPMTLNQGGNPWTAPAITTAGDVYMANAGGGLYKQTAGTGNFLKVVDSVWVCGGLAADGNNIIVPLYGGHIFNYNTITGVITNLGFPVLAWQGVTVTAAGIYASVDGGSIWFKPSGEAPVDLNQVHRLYRQMYSHGDTVRVVVYAGYICQQLGGTGDFNALPDEARYYSGITFMAGNWYVSEFPGDLRKQTAGAGLFAATGQPIRSYCGMIGTADSSLYIAVTSHDIYKWKPTSTIIPQPDYTFLIVGQSNMVGLDGADGYSQCSTSVYIWREGGWSHWDEPYGINGASMFPQLGNYLRARLDGTKTYGFIPRAVSAVGVIDSWSNPSSSMCVDAVAAVRSAGAIDGIIFMAGEADQWSNYTKAAYKSAFKNMIINFRDSCPAVTSPLPFYYMETHIKVGDSTIISGITSAQHELDDPSNKVYLAALTSNFVRIDDYHLSRFDQDTTGQRCGNAILYNYGFSPYYRGPRFESYQITKDSLQVVINLKAQTSVLLPGNPTGFLLTDGLGKRTIASDTMIGRQIRLNLSSKLSGVVKLGYLAENIPALSKQIYSTDALKLPAEGFYNDLLYSDTLTRPVYAPITINSSKIGETNSHFPYTINLSLLDTVWWNRVSKKGNIYIKTNAGEIVHRVVDSIDFSARSGYITFDAAVSASENKVYRIYACLDSVQSNSTDVFTNSNCIVRASLNGSASPLVDDAGAHEMAVTGGVMGQSGKVGLAIQQTGNTNILRTSNNVEEMTSARYSTVSLLLYITDVSAYSIYFSRESGDNEMSLMQYPGYGLQAHGAGSGGLMGRFYAYPFTPNTWYHVAVVHNGDGVTNVDQLKIIINGAQQTITEWGGAFSPTFVNSRLFMDYGNKAGNTTGTIGKIDEIRQFTTAKSAGWLLTEYNMYFDAGAITVGSTVTEASSTNNFGALIIGFSFAAVVGVGALIKRSRKKY